MQTSFLHVTETLMSAALEHHTAQLQPPRHKFTHLSPFQVQKFWGRVSLALLGQVFSSGPINFSEGAGLQITNMVLSLETTRMGTGPVVDKGQMTPEAFPPAW